MPSDVPVSKLFSAIGDCLVDLRKEGIEQRAILTALVRAVGNLKQCIDKLLEKK